MFYGQAGEWTSGSADNGKMMIDWHARGGEGGGVLGRKMNENVILSRDGNLFMKFIKYFK